MRMTRHDWILNNAEIRYICTRCGLKRVIYLSLEAMNEKKEDQEDCTATMTLEKRILVQHYDDGKIGIVKIRTDVERLKSLKGRVCPLDYVRE